MDQCPYKETFIQFNNRGQLVFSRLLGLAPHRGRFCIDSIGVPRGNSSSGGELQFLMAALFCADAADPATAAAAAELRDRVWARATASRRGPPSGLFVLCALKFLLVKV